MLPIVGRRNEQVRLGLIGCGRLAERGYLPALRRVDAIRLVAVADPVQERCRALAPEAAAYEDAPTLIAAGGVDAVVVATPASRHRRDAAAAAQAGLAALVEKPPAADTADAIAIAALEPAPWLGFNRRYEPGLERLRSAVPATGELELALELHNPGGSWGSHMVRDDALLSLGPHLIDLARWLTGSEIRRVRATELADDGAVLELDLGRGGARISCATGRPARDRVEVRPAPDGRALRYSGDGSLRRAWRRLLRPGRTGALVHLLARELEDFAAAVRGASPRVLAGAAEGIPVMAAIEAARESARKESSWCTLRTGPAAG
jgi:predicted dehydrogenase